MNCENIKEKLSLYIDNLLDPDETNIIREHIETCDSCRDYYDKLLKLGQMVDRFDISDKEDHWEAQKDKVMEQIERAESEKIIKVQSIKKRGRFYKYMAVAASLALVAFVSIYESQEFSQFNSMFDDSEEITTEQLSEIDSVEDISERGGQIDETSEETDVLSDEVEKVNDIKRVVDLSRQIIIKPTSVPKKQVIRSQAITEWNETAGITESQEAKPLVGIPAPVGSSLKLGEPDVVSTNYKLEDVLQSIDISPRTNSIKLLSINVPKADDKKEKIELSPEEMQKRAVENLRQSGKYNADMAMSVGLDEDEVFMADLSADKDSAVTEINIYKNRLDSLEEKYEGIYSPHYIESSAKGCVATYSASRPVSLDPVILEIAETCFQVGILSLDENEREAMIKKLRRLSINGSPESIEKIQRYIVLLLSAD